MVVITVGGFAGAGKSTVAKALVEDFGLRYVSAGDIFRQLAEKRGMEIEEFSRYVERHPQIDRKIDRLVIEEAKKGNVVIDGRLASWMVKKADVRILLTAPLETRVKRIVEREGRKYVDVLRETVKRERSEAKRFKRLYGIDINDHSVFDVVLSTERLKAEQTAGILKLVVGQLVGGR